MRLTVAELMTQGPVTVAPDCSADRAIEILTDHAASELYVVDRQSRLLGIVPDYELLKAGLNGESVDATVERLMSRNVPVFTPESDAAEVARLFRDCRFGRFPVVSAGRLVGVISRGDVLRLMAILRRIDSPSAVDVASKVRKPKLASTSKSGKNVKAISASRRRTTKSPTRSTRVRKTYRAAM